MICTTLHASSVAVSGRAGVILGPSGSGKSSLALQLMAWGAVLVADDRTELFLRDGVLMARCPFKLHGLIEARGVGILNAAFQPEAAVALVIDLSYSETDRLPPRRQVTLLGVPCDLVHVSHSDHFPAAVLCYLQYGRQG